MEKAWIISVNMGYGHQRTAFPLRSLAPYGKIVNANDYQGIPGGDRKIWEGSRMFYESISRLSRIPLVGSFSFSIYDEFQKIFNFYPKRDLSKPSFALKQIYSLFGKGWGRDLIETLRRGSGQEPLPIISTFFIPAFMAEFFGYPGEIFCAVCDADISRSWAPLNPKLSKIKYFVPSGRVVERLKLYGVRAENIFLTGYPLPIENIGSENLEVLKEDLSRRVLNLDPKGRCQHYYGPLIEKYIGALPKKSDHPLTIMFSVGGAGAQKEIAIQILKCLTPGVKQGEIKIILSAGIRKKVKEYFEKEISRGPFSVNLGKNIEILYQEKIEDYFEEFNRALRKADILWTKPSELSFYAALGLPILIAPSIGSQEEFNKRWLLKSGFGNLQEDPNHIEQWLFDWLKQGYLAEAALQGFIEGEKLGTFKIEKIICGL